MFPEAGLLDLALGLAIAVGVVAAFATWLVFPLLPFLLLAAIYCACRYGASAVAYAALRAEQTATDAARAAARRLAGWVLIHLPEPSHHKR